MQTVDRVLDDGDEVKLGDTVLVARMTPGHTPGCTTWTRKVMENGRQAHDVVDHRQPERESRVQAGQQRVIPWNRPGLSTHVRRNRNRCPAYFLGLHGSYFNMDAKYARLTAGARTAFVDPDWYKKFVAQKEREFRAELAKQKGR